MNPKDVPGGAELLLERQEANDREIGEAIAEALRGNPQPLRDLGLRIERAPWWIRMNPWARRRWYAAQIALELP